LSLLLQAVFRFLKLAVTNDLNAIKTEQAFYRAQIERVKVTCPTVGEKKTGGGGGNRKGRRKSGRKCMSLTPEMAHFLSSFFHCTCFTLLSSIVPPSFQKEKVRALVEAEVARSTWFRVLEAVQRPHGDPNPNH
jgi:hypothetical protein